MKLEIVVAVMLAEEEIGCGIPCLKALLLETRMLWVERGGGVLGHLAQNTSKNQPGDGLALVELGLFFWDPPGQL